ncbi:MAG: radical SAM protein [Phycisphaerae bacterium]|nr:radical SAM protein [Phycisphaerae bacterium]
MPHDPEQPSLFDLTSPAPAGPVLAGDVVIREVRCKSLLNRGRIDDYSFNAYVGCAHACGYCYARFMQRFHPHTEAWGRFVDVKINAVEVLARQLRKLPAGRVFTCSACDGWQPLEQRYRLTRECCRLLLDAGFDIHVLTKSRLVLRDLDLFAGRAVRLGVTITTPDERWARLWEPGAASVAGRLDILRQAKAAGLETTVMFGPLLPGISDTDEAIGQLFGWAAELGVDRIWTDILNPRPRVWPGVQAVLKAHAPELYEPTRQMLFEAPARRAYQRKLNERIHHAAERAGVANRMG